MFRRFLVLGVAICLLGELELYGITQGNETSAQKENLQPGDYVWQPQTAPSGPVVVVVNLSQQLLQVYRNGELIGRSTIGAGKGQHPTPTGIFTILQKELTHHSTKYHEASMVSVDDSPNQPGNRSSISAQRGVMYFDSLALSTVQARLAKP